MQSMDLTDLNQLMRAKYLEKLQQLKSPELDGDFNNTKGVGSNGATVGNTTELRTPLDNAHQEAEIARIQEKIKSDKIQADIERARLEAIAAEEREKAEAAIKAAEEARQKTQDVIVRTSTVANDAEHEAELKRIQIAKEQEDLERAKQKRDQEKEEAKARKRRERIKSVFQCLFGLALLVLIAIGLFRLYRWAVEEPLIKEIEKKIEIETIVEKEKIVEKEVEVEVVPEECTQIRRNGKIYMNCDGVTIDGANTIAESGIDKIPELID